MAASDDLRDALVREVEYRIYEECVPRIRKCLDQLSNEQIWWRPNDNSNSIGNLVLHLCGNVRQWIYAGLGQNEDVRHRQAEFDRREIMDKQELDSILMETMEMVRPVINNIPVEE